MVTSDGSLARSPSSLSAGGQEEQPWLVNSSTTARVCACAGPHTMVEDHTATSAQTIRRRAMSDFPAKAKSSPAKPVAGESGKRGPLLPLPVLRARPITRHSNRSEARRREASHGGHKVAQHVLQNAAVLEIFKLIKRVDPTNQRDALEPAVGSDDLGDHALARLDLPVQTADRHLLVAPEPQRLPRGA